MSGSCLLVIARKRMQMAANHLIVMQILAIVCNQPINAATAVMAIETNLNVGKEGNFKTSRGIIGQDGAFFWSTANCVILWL